MYLYSGKLIIDRTAQVFGNKYHFWWFCCLAYCCMFPLLQACSHDYSAVTPYYCSQFCQPIFHPWQMLCWIPINLQGNLWKLLEVRLLMCRMPFRGSVENVGWGQICRVDLQKPVEVWGGSDPICTLPRFLCGSARKAELADPRKLQRGWNVCVTDLNLYSCMCTYYCESTGICANQSYFSSQIHFSCSFIFFSSC